MQKYFLKNKKGSALVAVLLVLMGVSVVAISVIERSIVSLKTSTDTRESQKAYQGVDGAAEAVMNKINDYDASSNLIEGITLKKLCADLGVNFCVKNNVDFYETLPGGASVKITNDPTNDDDTNHNISKIDRININSVESQAVERAISAPLPTRIAKPEDIKVQACVTTAVLNTVPNNIKDNYIDTCPSPTPNFYKYKLSFTYDNSDGVEAIDKIILKTLNDDGDYFDWKLSRKTNTWINTDFGPLSGPWVVQYFECKDDGTNCFAYLPGCHYDPDGEQRTEISMRAKNKANFRLDSVDNVVTRDFYPVLPLPSPPPSPPFSPSCIIDDIELTAKDLGDNYEISWKPTRTDWDYDNCDWLNGYKLLAGPNENPTYIPPNGYYEYFNHSDPEIIDSGVYRLNKSDFMNDFGLEDGDTYYLRICAYYNSVCAYSNDLELDF